MHVRFDPAADALHVRLKDREVADTDELAPRVMLDRDAEGQPVGIEIPGVSSRPGLDPRSFAFDIATEAHSAV